MIHSDRLAAMQECNEQISFWTAKRDALRAAHQRACALILLADGPEPVWGGLADAEKNEKEFVLAAIAGDVRFLVATRKMASHQNLPNNFMKIQMYCLPT